MDYITKPCKMAQIETILRKALEKRELKHKTLALQTRVQAAEGENIMVGRSSPMASVQKIISTIAPTDSTIMILGETGTGKELAARTIFQQSKRVDHVFVPVNCGALAENLVESELFGHRKGAFTGADRDHKGLFEVANGGTLFLDEVGELNKNIQVKLLRFLESGEIRRLGDTEPFRVDVRVICATNRDLETLISQGRFRADLYYRLQVVEINLPPLRAHKEDIPELVAHFIATLAPRLGVPPMEVSADELAYLAQYDWPGNVRELRNLIERSLILGALNVSALYQGLARMEAGARAAAPDATTAPTTLHALEKQHILAVLESVGGDKTRAAQLLGVSRRTLERRYAEWAQGAESARPARTI